jgi:hypothetical protein
MDSSIIPGLSVLEAGGAHTAADYDALQIRLGQSSLKCLSTGHHSAETLQNMSRLMPQLRQLKCGVPELIK